MHYEEMGRKDVRALQHFPRMQSWKSRDAGFRTPNVAFDDLGGPNPGSFQWGLSFFFGRNDYTAIEQRTTPAAVGPYFAY